MSVLVILTLLTYIKACEALPRYGCDHSLSGNIKVRTMLY